MADEKAQSPLEALNARGLTAKREYVRGLEQRRDPEALSLLVECLCDESWFLRDLAEQAFFRMGEEHAGTLLPLLVGGLWYTRLSATRLLGRLGYRPAVPALIDLCDDTNETVSQAAREALLAVARLRGSARIAHALQRATPERRQRRLAEMAAQDRGLAKQLERLMADVELMAADKPDALIDPEEGARGGVAEAVRSAGKPGAAKPVATAQASPPKPTAPPRPAAAPQPAPAPASGSATPAAKGESAARPNAAPPAKAAEPKPGTTSLAERSSLFGGPVVPGGRAQKGAEPAPVAETVAQKPEDAAAAAKPASAPAPPRPPAPPKPAPGAKPVTPKAHSAARPAATPKAAPSAKPHAEKPAQRAPDAPAKLNESPPSSTTSEPKSENPPPAPSPVPETKAAKPADSAAAVPTPPPALEAKTAKPADSAPPISPPPPASSAAEPPAGG
jgi:PBS lyase HEAT-like repeat-containing protein